jgi:muconolactone delta-isomerase
MCIANADSPERLNDILTAAPGFPLCDLDVSPLADFAAQMERIGNVLKSQSR